MMDSDGHRRIATETATGTRRPLLLCLGLVLGVWELHTWGRRADLPDASRRDRSSGRTPAVGASGRGGAERRRLDPITVQLGNDPTRFAAVDLRITSRIGVVRQHLEAGPDSGQDHVPCSVCHHQEPPRMRRTAGYTGVRPDTSVSGRRGLVPTGVRLHWRAAEHESPSQLHSCALASDTRLDGSTRLSPARASQSATSPQVAERRLRQVPLVHMVTSEAVEARQWGGVANISRPSRRA